MPHEWLAPHKSGSAALTEKAFLKRLHNDVAAKATPTSASMAALEGDARPSAWTESHETELEFQKNKRFKAPGWPGQPPKTITR